MSIRIVTGDCREMLRALPDESVHCCVTSPPYFGLRDYGVSGQIGLEPTPDEYVAEIVDAFRQVRRVLRSDGTLWLNLGDSYANDGKWGGHTGGKHVKALHCSPIGRNKRYTGLKPKDRMLMPARVAIALQDDGWWVRDEIIWHKPNPMPSSVKDRTTPAHEMIYMLTKSERYAYDAAAIREPLAHSSLMRLAQDVGAQKGSTRANGGVRPDRPMRAVCCKSDEQQRMRQKRSVWTVTPKGFKGAHFATFPPDLIEPCILAGCPEGGVVLDPFGGSGTTGFVADRLQRSAILIEINPSYVEMARNRIAGEFPLFAEAVA